MTTEDNTSQEHSEITALLEENNRLQKEAIELIVRMRRTQLIRFVISLLLIILPLIAAVVVLPRFVTDALDRLDALSGTQRTAAYQLDT